MGKAPKRRPIVSLVIENDDGKPESRLFYADAKRRGFISIDDPGEVYHESQIDGTFEDVLAGAKVTEH